MPNKPQYNIVSFSGGKDSTAMLLRMIDEGMQIDEIIFCDTGIEFPGLYKHIDKVEKDIGRKITRLKSEDDFEYLLSRKPVQREKPTPYALEHGFDHPGYGWAGPRMRWCTEVLKSKPREHFLKGLKDKYDIIEYVGLAADEGYRLKRKCNTRGNVRHPLIDWNMTEADCLQYCKDRGYDWDGLYDHFSRVSCWCCPLQSLNELRELYEYFPELWQQLKKWDEMSWRPFRKDYSVSELEKRFDFEKQWTADGGSTRSQAFFSTLKKYLEETA